MWHIPHKEVEQKYKLLREGARVLVLEVVQKELPAASLLVLTDINDAALAEAMSKWPRFWDWHSVVARYRRKPRRVELAIWSSSELCGLAVGQVSPSRVVASIHYLQAAPKGHPLQGNIALIATRFLEAFGVMIGAEKVALERPESSLVDFYKGLGYSETKIKKSGCVAIAAPRRQMAVDVDRFQ